MSNPYAPPDPARPPGQGRSSNRGQEVRGKQGKQPRGSRQHGDQGTEHDSGGGGPAPWQRHNKEPDPPTQEQMAELSKSVLSFGLLMVGAVLTLQLDLPWQLASLAFAIAATVLGIRTMARIVRRKMRGGILVLLALGLMLNAMVMVTTASSLTVWDEQMERQRCLHSALTVTAQERCERLFNEAVEERFGDLP